MEKEIKEAEARNPTIPVSRKVCLGKFIPPGEIFPGGNFPQWLDLLTPGTHELGEISPGGISPSMLWSLKWGKFPPVCCGA